MSFPATLQELSKNPQYSPIVDAVIQYYNDTGGWSLITGLTEILEQIVFNELPLISQNNGTPISYTDLRALQVSDLLNSAVQSTDRASRWMMRDIVNAWIRKDFDRNCAPHLSTSLFCSRPDTDLRKALTDLNIRGDMLYHGLQEIGIEETLLDIPRKIIGSWAEGRSAYSLWVAETNSGFLTLGDRSGKPTTDVANRVSGRSKGWSKPFDDHCNLYFQHDEADMSDYLSDTGAGFSVSATTVALVRDKSWLGYCEFLVISPQSDDPPSNHLVDCASEGIENDDIRASFAASALTRQYGAPLMFDKGALVLLLSCEIVAEHRGHGIGFRLVEEALKELKRLLPDVRTIAWTAEPMQHRRGEWQEHRPPSIQAEYKASKEKLLDYCLSKEPKITAILSDAKGQAQSLMYRDGPDPEVFELFNVDEGSVPLVHPIRH